MGVVLAGRMLSEFGDDPTRFSDAASRRDYAGTAPITKASGKGRAVLMRRVGNTRLFGAPPRIVAGAPRDGRAGRASGGVHQSERWRDGVVRVTKYERACASR